MAKVVEAPRNIEVLAVPSIPVCNAVRVYGNNYDLMIMGSCFAIVPLLVLYLFAQRFIIEGMSAGAVKG